MNKLHSLSFILNFKRDKIQYNPTIDLLKSIAITMVIMYHCNSLLIQHNFFKTSLMCICSSCVPIFFILNGYLTLTPKKTNICRHLYKTIHLLFIIIIWSILLVSLTTLIKGETLSIRWIYNKILNNAIGYCNWIWFLNCLFILYLFKPILQYILNSSNQFIYTWIIVGIFSIVLPTCDYLISLISDQLNITYLSRNLNPLYGWPSFSLFYFMGGVTLNKAKSIHLQSQIGLLILGILLANLTTILTKKEHYDPVWNGYATIYTALISFGICNILLHKSIKTLPRIISTIGKNTLGIYLIEAILITYIKTVIKPTSSVSIGDFYKLNP